MKPALDVIRELAARGVNLQLSGTDIMHRGPRGVIDADLMQRLKSHKAGIIAELRRQTGKKPPPNPADVLERAAILEYCEGLPRAEADARAHAELTAAMNAATG